MAAGPQGAKDITVEYDDAPGGSLQDISGYLRGDVAVKLANMLEETHGFGEQWDESTPTGHAKVEDVTIPCQYDDTATTGPAVVFAVQSGDRDPQGATRTLKVTWGNGKSTSVETRLLSWQRTGRRGQLSLGEAVVRPTGAPTEV